MTAELAGTTEDDKSAVEVDCEDASLIVLSFILSHYFLICVNCLLNYICSVLRHLLI